MLRQICESCWGAVSADDPMSPYYESLGMTDHTENKSTFVADAVIANPPCMGHIHVCEALGIPLHIMVRVCLCLLASAFSSLYHLTL